MFFGQRGMEVKFVAVEKDAIAVVVEAAEAANAGLDHLNLGVEYLGDGVGYAVSDVVVQPLKMIVQHDRDFGEFKVVPVGWTVDRVN
jgi:hypothetical protein